MERRRDRFRLTSDVGDRGDLPLHAAPGGADHVDGPGRRPGLVEQTAVAVDVQTETVRAGGLEIDLGTCTARLDGQPLVLTTAEFELLRLFVASPQRVLSRERILDETRGVDWDAYDRSIDVLVSRLRHKLGDDPRKPAYIRTVRGMGYSFIGGSRD